MIYLKLFFEFAKIGLFAIGGGMATLPFLKDLAARTGWYHTAFITDMIAISESTPGPIGVNMATYVGYNVAGIPGGIIASLGLAAPPMIIILIVSGMLEKFRHNRTVEDGFYGLRPAVVAMIFAAGISVITTTMIHPELIGSGMFTDVVDLKKLALFAVMFFGILKFKKHPVVYIAIAAVIGILLKM